MLENNETRTELSSIGEFGLISRIAESTIIKNKSTLKGIGDDAAVIENGSRATLVSTDMLVEGIHFNLSYVPFKHLGYKAVVVNLSDIYAMNGTPRQITVSIALSSRFPVEAVEEFYEGVNRACEKYGVDLVGGDTSSSTMGLIISVTAIGEADKKDIVYRNTAKENDLICVSGDLGAAYLGLQILERERKIFLENPNIQPDLSGNDYLLERQLKPEARKDVMEKLKAAGIKPTSLIDISDGLASELLHICNDSGVGALIYEDKLPLDMVTISRAGEFNLSPTVCALNGGEDYELLFTIALNDYEKIKGIKEVSVIGHITDKASTVHLSTNSGELVPITAQGWDAFLAK